MAVETALIALASSAAAGSLASLVKRYFEARREVEQQVEEWEQPASATMPVGRNLEIRWHTRSNQVDHDRDGGRTAIELDPTDAESVHLFLNKIRQEEAVTTGGVRGPASPAG